MDNKQPQAFSKGVLSQKALLEDVRQLVRLLEESHPDPYINAGGKVAFHRQVHEILRTIPENGMTREAFLKFLRPLVASLKDGHTAIWSDEPKEESRKLWIRWDVVEEQLFVSGVYRNEDLPLLGQRLVALEGVPLKELMRRAEQIKGFDNVYHKLVGLADLLTRSAALETLLEREIPGNRVRVEFGKEGVKTQAALIPLESAPSVNIQEPATRIALPELNAADIGWGFIGRDKSVALLRIDSMGRYREAFELWYSMGFSQNLDDHLKEVAQKALRKVPPESVEKRIAAIPSATKTFIDLFHAMKKKKSRTLVIDLRNNSGGNSAMADILGYFLYGKEALIAASWDEYQIKRYSRLFFEKNQKESLGDIKADIPLQIGDYDYSGEIAWQYAKKNGLSAKARHYYENEFEQWFPKLPTFYQEFRSGLWEKAWTPRVVVLTSAHTYSAGYDMAALLYKNGAEIIGTPSSQTGNCFIDGLPYKLDNSGLSGSISYKRSLKFPDDPGTGEILRPSLGLTYEKFESFKFDPNAILILALEYLDQSQH